MSTHAELFNAGKLESTLLVLFIPSVDRNESSIDQPFGSAEH